MLILLVILVIALRGCRRTRFRGRITPIAYIGTFTENQTARVGNQNANGADLHLFRPDPRLSANFKPDGLHVVQLREFHQKPNQRFQRGCASSLLGSTEKKGWLSPSFPLGDFGFSWHKNEK